MSKLNDDLDGFARRLVRLVRDPSIREFDLAIDGRKRGLAGERWRHLESSPDLREALRAAMPEVVDEVIFRLLMAIDNGELPLAVEDGDGQFADLGELGKHELAGSYLPPGGWVVAYAEQRYVDPLAGVDLAQFDEPEDGFDPDLD